MGEYVRVLPRDLFNEASLLKCMGRIVILLQETPDHHAEIVEEQVDRFRVSQDASSGSIRLSNVTFVVRGVPHLLERPLNARSPWPLIVAGDGRDPDFEEVQVFEDDGSFTGEMLELIRR